MRGVSRRGFLGASVALGLAGCYSSTDEDRPSVPRSSAATRGVDVPVLCRDAWAAAPVDGKPTPHTIERLTVHHTAVPLRDNSDAPGQLRAIQHDHQSQPWTDIAYHYLIDLDGNIYAGRDPASAGDTFTSYDPSGHMLVCMLGDFDQQPLTRPGLSALVAILAAGAALYDVDASTIAGHDHYEPATSCPGSSIDALIDNGSLRTRVETLLAEGTPTLVDICGSEGSQQVAAIESS